MNREQSTDGNASERPTLPAGLLTEARAKIIWGDDPKTVRAYLVSSGVSQPDADSKVRELVRERNRELRGIGFRNLVIGLALSGISGVMIYFVAHLTGGRGRARILALLVLVGTIGLWKLVNGILYLLSPQTDHESIPDIPD